MTTLRKTGGNALILHTLLLGILLSAQIGNAKPRTPQPPWPQATLKIFGFDSAYGQAPWRNVALNEEESTLVESWSGYALNRSGLFVSPIVIPVRVSGKELNVMPARGSVRFWLAMNWSTASAQSGGKGPGHLAHLLDLVNLDGKASDVHWSLYVNEAGDTIHFVGQTKLGVTELLKVPVEFVAGDWRMITLCYSETNCALQLDGETIGVGEGVVAPAAWEEKSLGLVVGSDVLASPDSLAEAQFEELTTMRQWPRKSDWQEFYFKGTKRRSLLGAMGTREEEQAKFAGLKAAGLLPADYGVAKRSGAGDGPMMTYNAEAGALWLEVTGVSNSLTYLIVHGTEAGFAYEILSKESLTDPEWTGELPLVFGVAGQDWTATTVALGTRTNNLFFRVRVSGYAPGTLWLEITGVTNPYAYLTLHGTVAGDFYQLLSQTNLAQPGEWTLREMRPGDYSTNQTDFAPVYVGDDTNQFFRAQHAASYIYVVAGGNAYEPNAVFTAGVSTITIGNYGNTNLTAYYRMSGTASNGVDYTNLTGSVTVPAGSTVNLFVHPLADNLLEGEETVILTLVQTNNYVIEPTYAAGTILLKDFSTLVYLGWPGAAIEADGPPGVVAQPGGFYVVRYDEQGLYPPLTVPYSITGSASNGTDYTTLSGPVTFPDGISDVYLDINPVADTLVEGIETVTVTLMPTNIYAIDTNSVTVTIADSSTTVGVRWVADAIEPNPASNIPKQAGKFEVFQQDTRYESPALTVSYQLTGPASNGIDYTNMSGTVTIPAGLPDVQIFIDPLYDGLIEGDETVTLTVTPVGDGYLINTNYQAATLMIGDNVELQRVASLLEPAGIDYHQPSNSLIVSFNFSDGQPNNFARIYTNVVSSNSVTVLTNWSGVHGQPNEVKLVTVKATGNGFTNGDLYFSSGTGIGWLSADGTRSNLNWCILTNAVQTNAMLIRGSLGQDQTGIFSNHIIAVTSSDDYTVNNKGVWRVDAQGHPTLITNINTAHLEGVITLPNNTNQWGPWAGKIITGDEYQNLIYAIAPNGMVTTYDTTTIFPGGIRTEDFDIIPANQDLYACDLFANAVVKLSRSYLTNCIGDLLITDAGEYGRPGKLFVTRWDAAGNNFTARQILYKHPDGTDGLFEHVTFAPLNLPALNP